MALARIWVHVDRSAAPDPRRHLQAYVSQLDRRPDPGKLLPGLSAVDVDVAAKPQGMDRAPHDPLEIAYARQIDDRDLLFRNVGEHVPLGLEQLRGAAGRARQIARKKLGDERATDQVRRVGRDHRLAGPLDGQFAFLGVEGGAQLGQLLVAHQHEELGLGQPLWRLPVELGRAVGDGEAPVVGQALAGREFYALERFGVESFHRITAYIDDGDRHASFTCG